MFLSSLGFIFTSTFLSYYVQFPGLSSSSGIEPVGRIIPSVFPQLKEWLIGLNSADQQLGNGSVQGFDVEMDVICELVAILGIILSCVAASGVIHHGLLFGVITGLYCFLVKLGGTFYSFQWDILLLETGFLTTMCYAPWTTTTKGTIATTSTTTQYDETSTWPLRFLLFKLMFMSGVVKILSDCPTWTNLTALEYHFATQCLPTPLSWYAHQLRIQYPILLRVGVAMTLIIEIPMAFLLIGPVASWRRASAFLQLLLQILIVLTGNYNFFNVLTMVLCIPCLEGSDLFSSLKDIGKIQSHEQQDDKSSSKSNKNMNVSTTIGVLGFAWCFVKMFIVYSVTNSKNQKREINISLSMTKSQCQQLIEYTVPIAILLTLIFVLISGLKSINSTLSSSRKKSVSSSCYNSMRIMTNVLHVLICISCIGLASVPFLQLLPNMNEIYMMKPIEYFIQPWQQIQPFGLSNSYGLFRRMTGVGTYDRHQHHDNREEEGYGGLPPSIVKRPEIILEGFSVKTNKWRELNFRWKPGNIYEMPKQVAPHQPRLDWQMWFAALGSYHHNPWFINLIHKILIKCQPVVQLLDEPILVKGDDELSAIRAKLYHYDFTSMVDHGFDKDNDNNNDTSTINNNQWWTRSFDREYLPSIEVHNSSVESFLSAYGFSNICIFNDRDKCDTISGSGNGAWFLKQTCRMTAFVRKNHFIWSPLIILILSKSLMIYKYKH